MAEESLEKLSLDDAAAGAAGAADVDLPVPQTTEDWRLLLSHMGETQRVLAQLRQLGMPTMAQLADKYALYENSVQSPDDDCQFFFERFVENRGREPRIMKEDFCGTCLCSTAWVMRHPENRAVCVDIDPEPLAWGRKHNIEKEGSEVVSRLEQICDDVLKVVSNPPVDFIAAMNYSYNCFQHRSDLLQYFKNAYASLVDDGLFFVETFGGTDCYDTAVDERRDCGGFEYEWEQHAFNPATHHMVNHINFYFPDGSELKPAFAYEWRFWMMPELLDLLREAGFRSIKVYWGEIDDDGYVSAGYKDTMQPKQSASWLAYVVGLK